MTYYLTAGSLGVATERTPCPRKGKVILTFLGEHADSVSLDGRFYPIVDGRAEIPADAIPNRAELAAHAHAARRRYACGPLGRVGERGELVAPLYDPDGPLAEIAALLSRLSDRLTAAEERLASLDAAITRKPITFGGIQ